MSNEPTTLWNLRALDARRKCTAAVLCLLLISQLARAEELSVPIQILTPPTAAQAMTMAPNRPAVTEPPRVTPAARLPQYQLQRTDTDVDPSSTSIRLLLALPGRPLRIEAQIVIDGQPFGQMREARIQKLLSVIENPDLAAPAPQPTENVPTGTAQPPAEEQKSEEAKPEESSKPAAPEVPALPVYSSPATIDERLQRYIAATGKKPTAQELRWQLVTWIDGPVLLFLHEQFQRFRAAQQPLFYVLDTNRDQILSAEEITRAVQSLEECDLDRNQIVESTEIGKVAADPRNQNRITNTVQPLLLRLDRLADLNGLVSRLTTFYGAEQAAAVLLQIDTDKDGQLNEAERQSLLQRPADLVLRYDFHTATPDQSRLTVVSCVEDLRGVIGSAVHAGHNILLNFEQFALELSAVQGPPSDQVSVGAVNDGYAMLPELDSNGDGRLTIRERRTLIDRLKTFDRTGDGAISKDEIAATYRFCVALGPHVHQSLGTLRQTMSTSPAVSAGPDWFAEMDKNKDFDLTRAEFPGTDEQFQKLDLDSDQLISSAEASQATD